MNKELQKKIERLETKKKKEQEKINSINIIINEYDKQLKILYDYKKQQEKIFKMQSNLDSKIKEAE